MLIDLNKGDGTGHVHTIIFWGSSPTPLNNWPTADRTLRSMHEILYEVLQMRNARICHFQKKEYRGGDLSIFHLGSHFACKISEVFRGRHPGTHLVVRREGMIPSHTRWTASISRCCCAMFVVYLPSFSRVRIFPFQQPETQ